MKLNARDWHMLFHPKKVWNKKLDREYEKYLKGI